MSTSTRAARASQASSAEPGSAGGTARSTNAVSIACRSPGCAMATLTLQAPRSTAMMRLDIVYLLFAEIHPGAVAGLGVLAALVAVDVAHVPDRMDGPA